jgi:hypothetical protein
MDLPSVALALFGVFITVFIAFRQEKQLRLQREILLRLQNDRDRRDRTTRYFKVNSARDPRYVIVYPSYFHGKPVDTVWAGDFYAITTLNAALSMVLPEKTFELKPVSPHENYENEQQRIPDCDLILVCSPRANSLLKAIFPSPSVKSPAEIAELSSSKLLEDLPCWFVEDQTGAGEAILKIWDLKEAGRGDASLESPAEDAYRGAKAALEGGQLTYTPRSPQQDYGIILRTKKKNGRYVFVIAGIHQYGTWMAAKYLHDLFHNGLYQHGRTDEELEDYILGDNDFLAVIKGQFTHEHFHVIRTPHIEEPGPWIWRKHDDGQWRRFERRQAER